MNIFISNKHNSTSKSLMKFFFIILSFVIINLSITACSDKDTLSNNQRASFDTSGNDELVYAYLALENAIKVEDIEVVRESIKTFIKLDPNEAPLMEIIAWLLVSGFYEDAIEVLHTLLDINPEDFNANLLLVEAYIESDNKQDALDVIQSYIKRNPKNTQAFLEFAVMYIKLEKYDEANNLFSQVELHEMTPVFLYYYASSLKLTDDLEGAKEKLKLAISKQNDFTEALFELASIEDTQGNVSEAIKYYQQVLEIDASYYFSISRLMYLYLTNNLVHKAIDLSKTSDDSKSALIDVLPVSIDEGYYKEVSRVLRYLESVQELTDELLFYKAAIAYQHDKNIKKTLEILYKIPDTMPNYRRVLDLIIQIELESKMYSEALFHTKKAIDLFDDNITFYTLAMQLFFTLNQKEEAIKFGKVKVEELFQAPELSMIEADYLFYYASMLVVADEPFDSEKYFTKILSINPEHYEAMNSLAYHYALQGIKLKEALKLINKAITGIPNKSYLYDTLAWVQFKMHNYSDAFKNIKISLELAKKEGKIDPAIEEHYKEIEAKLKTN